MDETAPTTPVSDSATSGAHRPQAEALPKEYGMFTSDGMAIPEPADTAKTISDGAEALGMSSTFPTADTAPTPVQNSQGGLAADRTRLGGPTEDASGAFGGPEILKSVLDDDAIRESEQPVSTKQVWDSEVREAGIQRINDKLAEAQRSTESADETTTPPTTTPTTPTTEQPQQSTIPMVDQIASHATAVAQARLVGQWNHVEIPPRSSSPSTEQNPTV